MKLFKNIFFAGLVLSSSLMLTSCDEEILKEITQGNEDDENGKGLKEALKVGVDTAVSRLNVSDGYFKDAAVKLLLPPEMANALSTFKTKSVIIGGQSITGATIYNGVEIKDPIAGLITLFKSNGLKGKEDALILGINRAAEAATAKAKPIFVDAITSMSITDATKILFGADTAATSFLKGKTYNALVTAFDPKMEAALNSVQVSGKSVSTLYEEYVSSYNAILDKPVLTETIGSLMNINKVTNTDLSEYATQKGLDGLFLKVSDEEKNIRQNPLARVTELLSKIFGKLDK